MNNLIKQRIVSEKSSFVRTIKRLRSMDKFVELAEIVREKFKTEKRTIIVLVDFYDVYICVNGIKDMKEIIPIIKFIIENNYRTGSIVDLPNTNRRRYTMKKKSESFVETDIIIDAHLSKSDNKVCQYVQVGTETFEKPIFELRCGDKKFEENGEL